MDGERRYIIAANGLKAGDEILSGKDAPIKVGNCLPLTSVPIGSTIHCLEMKPGKGAQLARSAGASVQLIAREDIYATVRLRSGEMRKILADCRATIGEVSNTEHNLKSLGKAGASRRRGIRPTVRGVVKHQADVIRSVHGVFQLKVIKHVKTSARTSLLFVVGTETSN
jgi:large subunit ribosomal protein L2